MVTEYDVEGGYVPSLVEHLKENCARLGLGPGAGSDNEGKDVEDLNEDTSLDAHAVLHWTPTEHDALFRALSVHSRWRPDLIAACVPTKSEWEVWMYLEALEEGAARLEMEWDLEELEVEDDDGSGDRDVEMDVDEQKCEPAYEVSQEWIDAEEAMASWVIHKESLALAKHPASNIDEEDDRIASQQEPSKRKRGRPRTSEKERPRGRSRAKKISKEISPSPSPPTNSIAPRSPIPDDPSSSKGLREPSILPVRKRRRIEHSRDVLMSRLDLSHLLVLESILRGDDGATKDGSKSREGSVSTPTYESEPSVRGEILPIFSNGRMVQREASNPSLQPGDTSSAMLDPVLLALSGYAREGTSVCPDPSPIPGSADPQATVITPFSQNAIIPEPEPPKEVNSDLSLLSPRGRRRLQKRLYMRRRRALLRENTVASEDILDTGIEKLKPGRKAKSADRGDTPGMSTSVACSEIPSDDETDTGKDGVTHSKGGLTLPYKIKAQFARLGVDSRYLRDQGMDLLNLGALGRLVGLFTSLELQPKEGEEGVDETALVEYIDAELIRHLQSALVSFVTDVLHKAIVWKEGEKKLKDRSRAWRYGDQITISAIEHAVSSVGSRYHSHKQYFKSAVACYGLSNEADTRHAGVADQPAPEDTSTDTNRTTGDFDDPPLTLSLHREMYTPHIRPVPVPTSGVLNHLSPSYEQEATRTRRGSSADVEDDLMDDETDEDKLEEDLEEDDEVDSLDLQVSSTYEQTLWDAVRRPTW